MSATAPALLAASAGVGFGHAILPDHWVPLAVVGRTRHYPLLKIARLSSLAGLAHVLLSIVLGAVIIAVGLQFRSDVQNAQDTIIGGLLMVTGVGFAVFEVTGHGHRHGHEPGAADHHPHGDGHPHGHQDELADQHPHGHQHPHGDQDELADEHSHSHGDQDELADEHSHGNDLGEGGMRGLAALMVPFGAAASPDLTILPVFLAATTAGVATAVGSVLVFAGATIGTIVGLTMATAHGGYQLKGDWLERWGNFITAAVLLVIGALVLFGAI